ncbi:restriction endonuclease subunit M, partial [bacterium]|nr:restriction endonuclease subunit M [bacterium]
MAKTAINRKKAAKEFADFWKNKGDEKQHTQLFWTSLLRNVFGIEKPETVIDFEKRVRINGTKYIDAYIPSTNAAIEQKSLKTNLDKKELQSDGSLLTPYEQAKRYNDNLRYSERCRWIVVSNFAEFRIYDMEKEEPEKHFEAVLLENLSNDFDGLRFLVDSGKDLIPPETQVSLKAGELVGKLYDALIKEYINPDENSFRSLNILCVRIVFCLYAEDAGLFETRTSFEDYIKSFNLPDLRLGIINLFKALDTKPENRDKYDLKLKVFPYVNGGLFAAEDIEVPNFSDEIVNIIVNHCAPFDWSKISPTIFGAVFESTLNPETRRKGGMHYTSIENIHKVIDPLFLDDLRAELKKIVETSRGTSQKIKLEQFRNKIANLKFLDPACGSGNFLTETYISLRRLENEILKKIHGNQQLLGSDFSPIKVKISQFYGIEINDFAVTVAKTALWIAESQMMKETEEIVEENLDFLPLSTSATIVEGNALRMDWRYLREEEKIPTITAKKTNLIYPFEVHEREEKYEAINLITD